MSLAGRQDHLLATKEFMLCVGGRTIGLLKVFFPQASFRYWTAP